MIIRARLFSLFKEKYIKEFIKAISNNTYSLPSPASISSLLLNKIYVNIKKEVIVKLANAKKFHFILDESTNVNSNYIINLSITIPQYSSYFIANHNNRLATLNTTFFII